MSLKHYMPYVESCEPPKECKSYEPNHNEFCAEIPFAAVSDPCVPTLNKRLTGKANPRTLTVPTIAAPLADLDFWRQNPSYEHSQINKKTPMNPSWAGFIVPENASGKDAGSCRTEACQGLDFDTQIHSPFLTPLQPEIYTATDQFQAINNNLGIAYTPSFPNTTIGSEVEGNEIYYNTNRSCDPCWSVRERPFELIGEVGEGVSSCASDEPMTRVPKIRSLPEPDFGATGSGPDYIYDPRFTGYGASDRSYVDGLLGQPKFYYDDVNAVRMPNYITRSKVDSCVTSFGDAYGKLQSGHLCLADVRQCAEKAWVDNSLDYRTSLSKSLLRKANEEAVQRRLAPKYTIYPA